MNDAKKLERLRVIIARHKRWDLIFLIAGILALMIALLTFMALFIQMVINNKVRPAAKIV